MKNIGFIGVGYMGYGIAKNILKHKNNLFVIANKNRKPIEKIINDGAEEVKSFEDFSSKTIIKISFQIQSCHIWIFWIIEPFLTSKAFLYFFRHK